MSNALWPKFGSFSSIAGDNRQGILKGFQFSNSMGNVYLVVFRSKAAISFVGVIATSVVIVCPLQAFIVALRWYRFWRKNRC